MPEVANQTRLVLLVNHRESRNSTNSGILAATCLKNSEIHISGAKNEPLAFGKIAPADWTNLFLFPSDSALPLVSDIAFAKPVRLIVPDGTWSQATKIRRKVPLSQPVTFVTLSANQQTNYHLRRAEKNLSNGLATLEAIAYALAAIEGAKVSEPLFKIFRIFVERTLWSRGKLPAAQVYGGIPSL